MAYYRAAFAALQFAALLCCSASQVDRTLQEGEKGKDVVIATANKLKESGIFPDDFQFLRRMAYVETKFGETATPGNGGIWAVSGYSIEVTTLVLSTARQQLAMDIQQAFNINYVDEIGTEDIRKMDIPLYSALVTITFASIVSPTGLISNSITQQADHWKSFQTGDEIKDREIFIEEVHMLEAQTAAAECDIKGVDMIFVMDESGSIGLENFERMKTMALQIVDAFEIGPNRTQVGWINFNSRARVVFNLNTYTDKASLQLGIRGVGYRGRGTNIAAGLLELYNSGFTPSAGVRNEFDVPKVAIVVTDGQSPLGPIRDAAELIRNNTTIEVFSVGIGRGTAVDRLNAVAAAGITTDISRNVLFVPDFSTEQLNILQERLKERTCLSFSEVTNEEINGVISTVSKEQTVYISTVCPPDGLTIKASAIQGAVIIYISRSSNPSPALYDDIIEINAGESGDTFIKCNDQSRRRRQTSGPESEKIYLSIEGEEENNEYELQATTGDTSTPKVKLNCRRNIETNTLVVDCTFERMLTEVLCSLDNAPFKPCTLPWRVDILSPTIHLQINVTDELNLTDSAIIEYEVGPLVLRCSLNAKLEIECTSNNQLAPNMTLCSFNGVTTNLCTLPYGIDVSGLPAGVYSGLVEATDIFGSSASNNVEYQVVEDRVSDDMVMTVPLDINPLQIGESADTLSLCYQVHGEEGKVYNLLSDDCVSVNAHVSQPYIDIDIHVIDQIGIRAVGNNGTCYDITIERQNCAVSINNQPLQTNTRFEEEGIKIFDESVMRIPTIHMSVPNCGKPTIDHMFISCTKYTIRGTSTPTDILQFGSTRGNSQVQPPNGLIGQFWGAFIFVQNSPLSSSRRKQYDITVFPQSITPNVNFKSFISRLIPRGWGSQQTPCLYAGDRQGGAVIQGKYSDYEVNGLFGTQYLYSKFDESKC